MNLFQISALEDLAMNDFIPNVLRSGQLIVLLMKKQFLIEEQIEYL